jgi:DNA-binding protein WhiA
MKDCKQQILDTIADNKSCNNAILNVAFLSSQISADNILLGSASNILEKLTKIISNTYPNLVLNCWDSFLLIHGNITEMLKDINFNQKLELNLFEKSNDRLVLLKSMFLFFGGFYYNQDNNQNSKGYYLEFVLKDENLANNLLILLKERSFELKKLKRGNQFVVYTKNSTIISDLFVILGAQYMAMEIQNSLAMREIRNNVNRQNNCFEGNLDKTITASETQLTAINYILSNHSIDYLDDNLKEIALLRLANPDISLGELKTLLGNKISRAGIKYRLDKIIDIYNKLKNN